MHIISRLIVALREWFTPKDTRAEVMPEGVDWADLPTYHPSCD
jgi:hypothetical protein